MAKKKVFISYDYDNDRHYKNLLLAWDSNKLFDFSISDHSTDISINSSNSDYIKRKILEKISDCPRFLIIVGPNTFKSKWVEWEINKAYENNKKIIAVKTERSNKTPDVLYGKGANWAMSFTYESIKRELE